MLLKEEVKEVESSEKKVGADFISAQCRDALYYV